jgi:uncharacterized protein with GYD domain
VPHDPGREPADLVPQVAAELEPAFARRRVLATSQPDYTEFRRHDLEIPGSPGQFARRYWGAANAPVFAGGRVPSLGMARPGNWPPAAERADGDRWTRGAAMLKFVVRFVYSSASWARMLKVPEDRASEEAVLLEHLGGSLESIYWEVETASAHAVADLPDSVSAAAVITAATRTGAFKEVHVHEVLTQDQLREMVVLAQSSEGVYRPPGQAAIERDV